MDFCESANWASEASPTLGCPIEISCDIYIYVCAKTHAQSQFWAVKPEL